MLSRWPAFGCNRIETSSVPTKRERRELDKHTRIPSIQRFSFLAAPALFHKWCSRRVRTILQFLELNRQQIEINKNNEINAKQPPSVIFVHPYFTNFTSYSTALPLLHKLALHFLLFVPPYCFPPHDFFSSLPFSILMGQGLLCGGKGGGGCWCCGRCCCC